MQRSNAARHTAHGFQHGFYEHKTTKTSYRGSAGCSNGTARGRSFPARATGPKPLLATTALPGSPASQHNEDALHFPWDQARRVPPRELRSSPVSLCLTGDVPAPRPVVKRPLCPARPRAERNVAPIVAASSSPNLWECLEKSPAHGGGLASPAC